MSRQRSSQFDDVPVQELFDPASRLRWQVPELVLILSERAVAQARKDGDRVLRLRAEALAMFASNRLGCGVTATERGIAAFRDAAAVPGGDGQELLGALRIELASCARVVGSSEIAVRLLDQVLQPDKVDPLLRAHALIEFALAIPGEERDSERLEALDEAERLYAVSDVMDRDTSRVLLARVQGARACHRRRRGDISAAADAAVAGLALLEALADPAAESGEIHSHLVLERVRSLLDLGEQADAMDAADIVLNQPVRAAAANASGWLRLALANRVHLPAGEYRTAVGLLDDAIGEAERYDIGALLAEALNSLSQVHERAQDFPAALTCLRESYAADRRWRASMHSARVRLLEELPMLTSGVASKARREPAHGTPTPVDRADEPAAHSSEAARPTRTWTPVVPSRVADEKVAAERVAAENVAVQPKSEPEPEPVLAAQEAAFEAELERHRSGQGSARDAARRLMEALTSRAGEGQPASEGSRDAESAKRAHHRKDTTQPTEDLDAYERYRREVSAEKSLGGSSYTPSFPLAGRSEPAPELGRTSEPEPAPVVEPPAARTREPDLSFVYESDIPMAELPPIMRDIASGERGSRWPSFDFPTGSTRSTDVEPSTVDGERDRAEHRGNEYPDTERPDTEGLHGGWLDSTRAPDTTDRSSRESRHGATGRAAAIPAQPTVTSPDVTAIMPVIAVPPEGTPGVPEQSNAAPNSDSGAAEPEMAWIVSANEDESDSSTGKHGSPAVEEEPDEGAGRRSRGKSLDEIRAGLRLVPDSRRSYHSAHRDDIAPQRGGRRRRQAEDDEEEPKRRRMKPSAQASVTAIDEMSANPPANAGLADLLAEALMAYETGRRHRDVNGSESASRDRSVSGITSRVRSATQRDRVSTEDALGSAVRARHGDDAPSHRAWTPRSL